MLELDYVKVFPSCLCVQEKARWDEGVRESECDPKKILCAFFVRHAIAERYLSSFKVYGIKRMR
jgi:hypothetical protein